jgi:hypothetical protein
MIFLYTFVLLFLGFTKMLLDRRVARLERKYAKAAREADQFLRESALKPGNSARPDFAMTAKRTYLLGLAAQKRDRLELKHERALVRAEKFGRVYARIRNWKGKKLPYTFGAVDVATVMYAIDRLGLADYVSVSRLVEMFASQFASG